MLINKANFLSFLKSLFLKILTIGVLVSGMVMTGMGTGTVYAQEITRHMLDRGTFVYANPSLESDIITMISPQTVKVVQMEGQWLQIETYLGDYWLHTENKMAIRRQTGLFDALGDEKIVAYIPPQEVTVLNIKEGWVEIETNEGDRGWINPNFRPDPTLLKEALEEMGSGIAVYYKNLDTGFTFTHNAKKSFFAASLAKTNHALYVYQLAERGYIDIMQSHTLTSGDQWGGTGVLQYEPAGKVLTTRDLLHYSMVYSDNTAFRMLVNKISAPQLSYRAFVNEIGANPNLILDTIAQNTTATDAFIWMNEVYRYLTNDGNQYAQYLFEDMTNSEPTSHPNFSRDNGRVYGGAERINVNFLRTDQPEVMARKWGWGNNSFHEAAIVFGASPYIIVVLTNQSSGALRERVGEISLIIDKFNNTWF